MFRKYRMKYNLSITELADMTTSIDNREIERYESRERCPLYENIAILCYILNIPKDEVVAYLKNPPKKKGAKRL